MSVTETCSCGAQFTYSGSYPTAYASNWREGHKHAESVGICADRPPALNFGPNPQHWCVLKAGHDGAHSDGQGHWIAIPPADPAEGSA